MLCKKEDSLVSAQALKKLDSPAATPLVSQRTVRGSCVFSSVLHWNCDDLSDVDTNSKQHRHIKLSDGLLKSNYLENIAMCQFLILEDFCCIKGFAGKKKT